MTKKVKPTLYLALGDAASSIVQQNLRLIEQRNKLLSNILLDISISDEGKCSSAFKGEQYFSFKFNNDITEKGVFKENYDIFVDKETNFYDLIRKSISNINQYEKRRPLVEQEYEIGEPQVVVFSSLHGPVASTLITPILKQIHSIKQEVNYLYSEVTGIFMLPDLFHAMGDMGSNNIVIDYEKDEKIAPRLSDNAKADNRKIAYRPIDAIGRKSVPFLKGEDSSHKIDIRDIDQGTLGSCYFLGLLGGIARTQAEFIENMIVDNLDNTYTVRFYNQDGTEKHVTVDNKFWLAENGVPIYSNVSDTNAEYIETWVMLIEKAWAKWHGGYDHIEGSNTKKERYDISITGNPRSYLDLTVLERQEFFDKVYTTFHQNKQPIVFASKAAKEEGDDEVLEENHAYILQDISLQNQTLNLYNPHGHDHLYNLDWSYIQRHFVGFSLYNLKPHEKAISRRYKEIRDLEYCRALASVTELDAELNKSEEKGVSLLNYVFIVGNKNSRNITLGSFEDMLISLSEFSLLLVNEGFATTNLGIQLGDDIDGKRNRYSSIGYSTLLYPEESFIEGLKDVGKTEILGELQNNFKNQKFTANTIGAETNAFLSEQKFDQYLNRIQQEEDGGKDIYDVFQFSGKRDQDVPLQNFLSDLEKQSESYQAQTFNKLVIPKIENRQKALTQKLSDDIRNKVNKEIDTPNRGINFAHAFTSSLLREDCEAISGQVIDDVTDLRDIENEVLQFYRNRTDLPQLMANNRDQQKLYQNKERLLRKTTNELQRLEEKINNAQDGSQSDLSAMNTEFQSKQTEKDKLEKELEKLKQDYESGKLKEENLKRELESPEYRKTLREADLAKQHDAIDEHLKVLQSHENTRNQHLEYIEELKKKKDKFFKRHMIFLPLLYFGIPSLIFTFLEFFYRQEIAEFFASDDMKNFNRIELYVELFLLGLVVYGIWAFIKYRKKIKKEWDAAQVELNDLNQKKVKLYNEHTALHSNTYKLRFDHMLHASAFEGIEELIKLTDHNKQKLGNFKKAIYDSYGESKADLDGLHFENNLFQNSIIKKDDVGRLKLQRNLQKFLTDKGGRSLKDYFYAFEQSGNMNKMEGDVEEHLSELYTNLQDRSVMDFLYRDEQLVKEVAPNTRIKLLKDASEVYINLKDYGTGDQTEESSNLYCDNFEDPDSQKTQELVKSAGLNAQTRFSTGDKNSVSLFRALKGFPAFQITLMDECRTIMKNYTETKEDWTETDFYVKPALVQENIFPSTLTLGTATDDIRIAFAQGRALGIVEDGDCYCFKGVDLGKTVPESIKYLRSLKGESIKDELLETVENRLNEIQSPETRQKTFNEIKDYVLARPKLDDVDRKILDNLMRSLV